MKFFNKIKSLFKTHRMSKLLGFVGLGFAGLVLVTVGAVILFILPNIVERRIKEELRLINGSEVFERWRKIPAPITIKFYIFELKNPDNYTNLDDIQLKERGPYVFDESRTKEDIVFYSDDNNKSAISYRERRQYTFNEDLSVGDYNENITFINVPILGVIFNEILTEGKMGFDLYKDELDINEKSLFTRRTVRELLFDGIDVKLYKLLEPFLPDGSGITLTPFSLFNGMNGLLDEMSIFSNTFKDKFNQIFSYDNKSELRNDDKEESLYWPYHEDDPTHSCNALRGTDATLFAPDLKKDHIIYIFEPQICRTMFFEYLRPSEVKGIETYKFYMPKETYQSPFLYKPNSCYCTKENISECDTNGVLEISHCLRVSRGAPVMISTPYFLYGDNHFRDDINLFPPKPLVLENYGTTIDIEPMTGIVLRAFKRMQISIKLSHSDSIPQLNATKAGKDYVIPALWLEEGGEIDQENIDLLNRKLFNKKRLITGASIAAVVMGFFLIMVASYLITRCLNMSSDQ